MKAIPGILVALAMLSAACGSGNSSTSTPTQGAGVTPSASPVAPVEPLVGVWRRETTCEEFVKAQEDAGFEEVVLDGVAGNGFIPGVKTAEQLADPSRPCEGAVPREHSHFFRDNGEFGSLDWKNQQVDDGTYTITNDHTFTIGNATFEFEIIDENTIMFEPVIPKDCSSKECREMASWMVAVAYPGKTWERVT